METRLPLLAMAVAAAMAACAPGNPARPPGSEAAFREIQRDADVYRITLRWRGAAPADAEERLLLRCADVTQREGARYFYLVNADFDVTNQVYLKEGSALTPVFRVPEEDDDGRRPGERASATVTIKLFRAGEEPLGYRLYDAEKIRRAQAPVTIRLDGAIGGGVGR